MSTKEYNIKFNIGKDDKLLICPICGEFNLKQLTQHLTWKHNMTKEQFLQMYPNTKLWISEISERCSKAQQKGIQSYKQHLEIDPHYYDSAFAQRHSHRNYEEIKRKILKTRSINNSDEKMSARMKQVWKDEEYIKNQSLKAINQHKNGLTDIIVKKSGRKRYSVKLLNITYYMRSTWEVKTAKLLVDKHIDFKYEPFTIKYIYDNKNKLYYPDFYLPKYNLILEVKPYSLCNDDKVQAKKNACISQGYNFMFITENELKYYL